jgi:Holliday junction resolvase RusA-like endonuclease
LIAFSVPGKPVSTNATYRTGRGHWFKDASAKAWQSAIALCAARAMIGKEPLTGSVEVGITFYFQDKRPDVDGPVKDSSTTWQGLSDVT